MLPSDIRKNMIAYRRIKHGQSAFTVIELLVACSIFAILSAIAYPSMVEFQGQLRASEDARVVAHILGEVRAESIRLRANSVVEFRADGLDWDINDDGVVDGSFDMHQNSVWASGTPADLTFNGLGLARGIGGTTTYTIRNRGSVLDISINSNGHISL